MQEIQALLMFHNQSGFKLPFMNENNAGTMPILHGLTYLHTIPEVPSIDSVVSILQQCKIGKKLEDAHYINMHICNHGIDTMGELGRYLIPMFIECGSLADAEQTFHRLEHQNEHSWTSLIYGYLDSSDDAQQVFVLFQRMQEYRVSPSRFTYIALVKACARLRCVERGRAIHSEVIKGAFDMDMFVASTLVDMYAKCGSLSEAHQVFDNLTARDVVSWNALIAGYADHGCGDQALICVDEMQLEGVPMDDVTTVFSLKACGSLGAIEHGREIHCNTVEVGTEDAPCVGSALMDMYAKCGSLVEVRKVFDSLPSHDTVTWTALIAANVEHEQAEEALNCFEQMRLKNVVPNAVTFVCILTACGKLAAVAKGQKVHTDIVADGFENDLLLGNALIDMYNRCGSIIEAQEVFDELPQKDHVSWNTLIAGYTEHGHGAEAILILENMQVEGIPLDSVSFVSGLKACGSVGATKKGQELHSEIIKEGFEAYLFIGNTLLDMYTKCSLLVEAKDVFDDLQIQDTVSWTALIAGYVEHQQCEEALYYLEQMESEGVLLNATTFIYGLKTCGSLNAIEKGYKLHADVIIRGLEAKSFVGDTTVFMYAKCGSLLEAQKVFNELPVHSIVSWNILMAGYAEHGLGEQALSCLDKIQREGMTFDHLTYISSLKACGHVGAIDRIQQIHVEICKEGFEGDVMIGNALIDACTKCGLLADAWEAFVELQVRDVFSWTALIAGHAEHGLGEEALNFFNQMQLEGVSPDVVAFVCALKVCSNIEGINRGQEIHADIVKKGFEVIPSIANTLINMYADFGCFKEARNLFNNLVTRDGSSWNALMTGYIKYQLGEEALNCFEKMQLESVCADVTTFNCGLKACYMVRDADMGQEVHAMVTKKGLERDPIIGNTLVDMYAKFGSLVTAKNVLQGLPQRDVVTWTTLLAGYAEHGLGDEALKCIECMSLEGLSPNIVSWNAVIFGYVQQGNSKKAIALYLQMQEQGLLPDMVTFASSLTACGDATFFTTARKLHSQIFKSVGLEAAEFVLISALLDMYSKCGTMVDAQLVFNAVMPLDDLFAWTTLITGYARIAESEAVFHAFDRMREGGVKPNDITFLAVLNACSHAGLVNKGLTYFKAMTKEYGIVPSVKHHNCMLDLLGRAGQLVEAEAILQRMSRQADLVTWGTVLGACQKWGNIELGQQAFDCASSLDGSDDAAFSSMLNICADAYAWQDASS